MKRQKAAITTFGCRLNQFDSDAIERQLVERGYDIVASPKDADVHIINSCTITHAADGDAKKALRRSVREAPQTPVALTGCYATGAPEEAKTLEGVSWVIGNASKANLVGALEQQPGHDPDVDLGEFKRKAKRARLEPNLHPRRTRAYLKIQDGCNYRCSFCIVPQVRGPSESIEIPTLLRQTQELVAAGAQEIVLTGVHLGTYGRDLSPKQTLATLLRALLPHLGSARVRMGSVDPHEVDDELIDVMANHQDKICRYLHLPIQSGDDGVLKRMRRGHTADDMRNLVPKLVERIPGIGLGTDIIAGFPGESDEAFQNTVDLLDSLPLSYFHVFPYSKRQNTAATSMDNHIPEAVKKARCKILRDLSEKKHAQFRAHQQGQAVPCPHSQRPQTAGA